MKAFEVKNLKAIAFLLQSYPDLSLLRNKYGKSPLMSACQYGLPIKIVEQLLNCGADLNETDHYGASPLH